jgi:hypothetical protein
MQQLRLFECFPRGCVCAGAFVTRKRRLAVPPPTRRTNKSVSIGQRELAGHGCAVTAQLSGGRQNLLRCALVPLPMLRARLRAAFRRVSSSEAPSAANRTESYRFCNGAGDPDSLVSGADLRADQFETGTHSDVKALVYVAAVQPDVGESLSDLADKMPPAARSIGSVGDGFLAVNPDATAPMNYSDALAEFPSGERSVGSTVRVQMRMSAARGKPVNGP